MQLFRRGVSILLCFAVLISGAAYRPQKADAIAVTTTAAVVAGAAAILTACGVSYWASNETNAIDYLSGKIDDYLDSIDETGTSYEEWLELSSTSQLFEVVSGGVMQFTSGIANKLLDFCRWLQDDEGIESGGDSIASGTLNVTAVTNSNASIVVDLSLVDDNTFIVSTQNWGRYDNCYLYIDNSSPSVDITIDSVYVVGNPSGSVGGFWYARYLNSYTMNASGSGSYVQAGRTVTLTGGDNFSYIGISIPNNNGSYILQFSLTESVGTLDTKITPSDFVNVPAAIDNDAVFSVKPSVDLASGDSVDDATQSILDGITSEDGISSSIEDTPDTSWGWLYTLLVNIAEAIIEGVADIKQAVLGLADSIYNKFTTILQDIKSGISTIVNSITSAVSQLLSAVQALPTTIYSQFTQVLQDIKTGIQGIALDIYTDVINALTYVFVPSQAFIDTYVASLYATFDNHFSILSYPFSILGEFITRASGIGSPEPMFTWGNIYEPFSGKLLIAAGSYNLNSMLSNQTFAQVYSIYMIVVKGLISFAFLKFLYSWFCDVFKMREDDFSSPLDVEDGDDASDFDGYDGYYSS